MTVQPIDDYARDLNPEIRAAIHKATTGRVIQREKVLFSDFPHANQMRKWAGELKRHTMSHLNEYLEQAANKMESNGVQVHFASTPESARTQILDIFKSNGVTRFCKSKSMVTEELEVRPFLEEHGIEVWESDLGEFVVQLDNDRPSHIVTPIIHKNKRQVAETFKTHGLGEYTEDPQTLTRQARKFLREKYLSSTGTMTGANFVSAESGRIVVVTNEGNSRFGLAAAKVHIAVVGIEKLVPRDEDLTLFLNLLARSSTGQHLSVYTEFIGGPRSANQPEGPEQMHVVFIDNGRTEVLASDCREALHCIRCGACLNVCPVFRQASGFAYRHTYPGPIGAVLAPNLVGKAGFPELADLPKASSLCGACNEVCPVNIPIPDLLLRLRNRGKESGAPNSKIAAPPMGAWSSLASSPTAWNLALKGGHLMNVLPQRMIPVPAMQTWLKDRVLPDWQGGQFRKWMKNRASNKI
jgi:L-lactate dehydrogenase complex protein LldF